MVAVLTETRSAPEQLVRQLMKADQDIPLDMIDVGERQRGVSEKAVAMLMESLEHSGLAQRIGVRRVQKDGNGLRYLLIWGQQRLEAFRRLHTAAPNERQMARWQSIPAAVYSEISDQMAALLEIEENLARDDLTAQQRKDWAARKLKLVSGTTLQHGTKGTTWYPPTREDAAKDAGIPMRTFLKWYQQYKHARHGKDWNKQSMAEYDAFLEWLCKAEQRKAEDDAKKAAQTRAKQLDAAVQSLKDSIDAAAKKHGKEVYSMIADWLGGEK